MAMCVRRERERDRERETGGGGHRETDGRVSNWRVKSVTGLTGGLTGRVDHFRISRSFDLTRFRPASGYHNI